MNINGNIATFDYELVLEGSFGSADLGMFKNQMEFEKLNRDNGHIIWNFGREAPDEDETVIGIWFNGMDVYDYDGVCSLPSQAVQLLESLGYNCEEVK